MIARLKRHTLSLCACARMTGPFGPRRVVYVYYPQYAYAIPGYNHKQREHTTYSLSSAQSFSLSNYPCCLAQPC